MSKLVCKDCKSTDVTKYTPGIFGDSRHRCNSCGRISLTDDFIAPALFDRITTSPEVLAEKLVYLSEGKSYGGKVRHIWVWCSTVADCFWETRSEAIAATVAKLKEVAE